MNLVTYVVASISYGIGALLVTSDFPTGLGSALIGFGLITALKGLGDHLKKE